MTLSTRTDVAGPATRTVALTVARTLVPGLVVRRGSDRAFRVLAVGKFLELLESLEEAR